MNPHERRPLSRRGALGGLAAAGVGLPLLAACSGDDGGSVATDPAATPSAEPTPSSTGSGSPEAGSSPATPDADTGDAEALVPLAEVAVGGGVVLADAGVVVTQPTAGEVRAFTTTCTHQGCPVTEVADGSIVCPCHRSLFSIEDGAPTAGPAASPLEAVAVTVRRGSVVRA